MNIQAVNNLATLYAPAKNTVPRQKSMDNEAAIFSDTVTISDTAKTLSSTGSATENDGDSYLYDFSNMSPQQLLQTMNKLITSGKMSLDESSSLVGLIPTALSKANFDGQPPAEYYKPANIFSKLEEAIAYDKHNHNETGVLYGQKAIAALQRFQSPAGTTI